MEFLQNKQLLTKSQKLISANKILKKRSIIIFFFSASWCDSSACANVLELLKIVHKESKKRSLGFEIIYISSDTDKDLFLSHFKEHGDWYAIPFENNALSIELRITCRITSLPNLTVYRTTGKIIAKHGHLELLKKGINVLVTWSDVNEIQ